MTLNHTRLIAGAALATSMAIVAACSGTSPSMSPTAPTASASGASAANFSPNPNEPPPDPCAGAITTNPNVDPPPCETGSGRFTGGGFQIGEVKVTRGFTIHCDTILTNNLEVNWGGGNNFHIDKEALTTVACSRPDDPTPPASPVSRIVASSPGTCNNAPATINFILEDHGEPGTNDRAQLVIVGAGSCNLNLPLANLDGGNIQAHFDQPHK